MMIDIDHFKLYNDRYGHVAGDTCLRSVGETLSLVTLEDAVLVARYGGEEFALLLPGLDLPRIGRRSPRRRAARSKTCMITHAEAPCGHVTISVGVDSMVPDGGPDAADLVEAADRALYAAKRRGRNRVDANAPSIGELRPSLRRGLSANRRRWSPSARLTNALRLFFSGGAQIMASSFMPSGSAK